MRYALLSHQGQLDSYQSQQHYLLRAILASRTELGLPSDADGLEEDVNIYLAYLLAAYSQPRYFLQVAGYLSDYDQELFDRLSQSQNNRLKYQAYRINADHLTVMLGVFGQDGQNKNAWHQKKGQDFVGRAVSYYDYAACFGSQVFGRGNAVPEVMDKLSKGLEKYLQILRQVRSQYFNLVDGLSPGELFHLEHEAIVQNLEELHNQFLDALRQYQKEPTPDHRLALEQTITHLQSLDPHFSYHWPE